jgi:hypothetical protein
MSVVDKTEEQLFVKLISTEVSMRRTIILVALLNVLIVSLAYGKEISFTQDDRDRLIRLEEGQKSLEKRMMEGQNSLQRQIDDLKAFMLWGFGILFGGMGILIGFVIWDRRTALAPVIKSNRELEIREERIERALKELAEKDHNVAEALKHAGLL